MQNATICLTDCELGVDAAIREGELGVFVQFMQFLKNHVEHEKTRENTAEIQACETMDKISELRLFAQAQTFTVCSLRLQAAELVDVERWLVHLAIHMALFKNKGIMTEAIWDV